MHGFAKLGEFLALIGGTMSGDINMGGNDLIDIEDIDIDGDVVLTATAALDIKDHMYAHTEAFTTSSTAIDTTEETKLTATISIPTDWSGYTVRAWGKVDWIDAGAGGSSVFTLRVKYATVLLSGGSSVVEMQIAAEHDLSSVPFAGYLTGQTATGSQDFIITTQSSAEDDLFNVRNLTIICEAWRTS